MAARARTTRPLPEREGGPTTIDLGGRAGTPMGTPSTGRPSVKGGGRTRNTHGQDGQRQLSSKTGATVEGA